MPSYKTTRMEGKMMRCGFEKSTMTVLNEINYELHCHNPMDVLVEQAVNTPSDGIITTHGERAVYDHPLNAFIGWYAFPAVEIEIEQYYNIYVSGTTYAEDGVQSLVGVYQFSVTIIKRR